MKVSHALAVSSGTAALRVGLAAMGIGKGDEVITQSFTFVATVEAIIEAGATPIIAEIDETLNIDPEDLKRKITSRTKAVMPVHMLGTPARMEKILEIARANNLRVFEDSAWGCGGTLNGQPLGTIGDMGAYSFDFAKTMTTGEGGMLVTNNAEFYAKAAAYHDHGHENNPNFPRWEDSRSGTGFNYRVTELQGAVGLAQLKKLDEVVRRQRENADTIWTAIRGIPGIQRREQPSGSAGTADALVFFVNNAETAKACRKALLEAGAGTKILPEAITWHFAGTWTHMPELVAANGNDLATAFPASLKILERAVALPIVVMMNPEYPQKVATALRTVLK
jgi:8-amino-3,8-dideoxy-alpha-D-manno-octulosonate transaminase